MNKLRQAGFTITEVLFGGIALVSRSGRQLA